jgi:IclR family mhp operon transcriptional activator
MTLKRRRFGPPAKLSAEPIQGLEKGLEVLAFLNRRADSSVADVMRMLDLPRTTALRVLETRRGAGYVDRGGPGKRYRLTIQVRELSDGYDDEQWISDIASPVVQILANRVVWPILVATPVGSSMLWRENTDHKSPLALVRYAAGMRVPTVDSASGHVYLAFCTPQEGQAVLELFAIYPDVDNWIGLEGIERTIKQVRRNGYAILPRRHQREIGMSVPVLSKGRYLASLTIRCIYGALTEAKIVAEYLQPMQEAAAKIGEEFAAKVELSKRRKTKA